MALRLALWSERRLLLRKVHCRVPSSPAIFPYQNVSAKSCFRLYGGGSFSGKSDSIEIDKTMKRTRNWKQLLGLYEAKYAKFDYRNWATLFNKLKNIEDHHIIEMKRDKRFRHLNKNLTSVLVDGLENFSPQAVANILHALAKMQVPNKDIADILDRVDDMADDGGDIQSIANIAWAYATVGYEAPKIFGIIEDRAVEIVNNGKEQAIANIAWSCATLQCENVRFFQEVENNATQFVNNGSEQHIANTLWACAKLRYDVPKLLAAVDSRSDYIVTEGTVQGVANLALAFAELDHAPDTFFRNLASRADHFIDSNNNQHICNTLWSMVVLDLKDEPELSFLKLMWRMAVATDADKFIDDGLRQLEYVRIFADANGIELKNIPCELKRRMREACAYGANQSGVNEKAYSALLTEIGFDHERDVSPIDGSSGGFLAVDFACKDQKIAVEYDGDHHFLTNLDPKANKRIGRETGRTKAKRRLLQRLGWKVVSIPYHDNMHIDRKGGENSKKRKKKKDLKKRLKEVGAVLNPK